MKVVVDASVIASYILHAQPFAEEAADLFEKAEEPIAPSIWHSELANAVWRTIVHGGVLDLAEGLRRLEFAKHLPIRSYEAPQLWKGALVLAVNHDHPVYDTLYVQLAVRESIPLATFDRKLLAMFPDIAKRPQEIVAAA